MKMMFKSRPLHSSAKHKLPEELATHVRNFVRGFAKIAAFKVTFALWPAAMGNAPGGILI
jgi:hypothetical protein